MLSKRSFSVVLTWTTTVNIAATLFGLLTGVILARVLGPEGRGQLAAIQNLPNILLGFGSLGISTAAAYLSGRQPHLAGRFMTTSLIVMLLWSIPLVMIVYVAMPVLLSSQSREVIQYAQIYLLIIPIQFAIGAPFWVLQGIGEFKIWNILRIQAPIAWVAIIGVTWALNLVTVRTILLLHLAAMFLIAFVFIALGRKKISGPYRPEFSRLPELLRYGLPTCLTAVPQQLNQRLDQILMAMFMPAELLGVYVVAVTWSNVFSPMLTSVSQVLFPRLAADHDPQAQAEILSRTMRMTVLSSLVLSAVLIVITPIALPVIFGNHFAAAVPTTLILIFAACIATINQVGSDGLRGLGAPKLPMICESLGLVTTMVMLGLLLGRYELIGAAIASLTSYTVTLALSVHLLARETRLSPWSLVIPRRQDVLILGSESMKVWRSFWRRMIRG